METGEKEDIGRITMKETEGSGEKTSDEFIKTDSTVRSMKDLTNFVGIYFSDPIDILGEDGEIYVYDDETGNLLETFDKTNGSKYSETNPYKYEGPVKHIRIESSNINARSSLTVFNIKEIDDQKLISQYNKEEFRQFQYISSTLAGYLEDRHINTDKDEVKYVEPVSVANVSISKNAISTQGTEKNIDIKIKTETQENNNEVKWTNGAFLLKLPEGIIDLEINSVNINNKQVIITSYEQYEENGEKFIKINTENEEEADYEITVNCNITADPRIATVTQNIELYAYNENNENYYNDAEDIYDINNNLNIEEKVNKTTTALSLVSPNTLLTSQVASNYDNEGSEAVAPQIAYVSKEQRKATIGIVITNNYSNTISEVKILGKIPTTKNTYVINGGELGSNFDTTMTNAGIQLPAELQGIAKVYYSEQENPTQDTTDTSNGWTLSPSDFSQIKSYLIDLGDKLLTKEETCRINYEINVPEGIQYNQTSYSHHAVYFSLNTENGKYKTQTEPNKLGIRIAKQYDLELTKYQKGISKVVSGATYSIQEEGEDNTRTRVTNTNGKLELQKLSIDKIYTIKEIKSPTEYELSKEEIKFVAREENGQIKIEKISGNVRSILANQESNKIQIEVEDEVRASLKIVKQNQATQEKLKNIKYKLTGKGLPTTGRILTTNTNGEINIKGLYIGEEYILEETIAEGYYLASPIKFIITNNEGTYTANVTQDELNANIVATKENEIPTLNLTINNEKIPEYNLIINKVVKDETTPIQGVKFALYKGEERLNTYTTDEQGRITINGLYQYVAEKQIDQTYTLKEVQAPEGYAKVEDITFYVEKQESLLNMQVSKGTVKEANYTENTVTITVEDSPTFKLIKKDGKTKELLEGVKFAIYNYETGEPATDTKGNIIGEKQVINRKTYYVVTTNKKGEITANLAEGLYEAVEVETFEKYELSKTSYYFGIGMTKEEEKEYALVEAVPMPTYIDAMVATKDGGYIAGGEFSGSSIQVGDYTLTNAGSADGILIKYSSSGEVEWATSVGGTEIDSITSVAQTTDGGYIVGGNFHGESIQIGDYTLTNVGRSDGMLIKYNSSGEVEWATTIGGNSEEEINSVATTRDGGYIVGGKFDSKVLQVGEHILTNTGNSAGMLVKYKSNNEIEWAISLGGANGDSIKSVAEANDEGYIIRGYFYAYNFNIGNSKIADGLFDGRTLIKIKEIITEPEFPETQEIIVENNLKQYRITTEVEEINGIKGGAISGENETPYEIVEYGNSSTKQIKMVQIQDMRS